MKLERFLELVRQNDTIIVFEKETGLTLESRAQTLRNMKGLNSHVLDKEVVDIEFATTITKLTV